MCGFKPLLVVMNHFLLEVKAGNKFPVVWVTSKHSSPLLLLALPANSCLGVGISVLPHPVFFESPRIVRNDTDSSIWDQN